MKAPRPASRPLGLAALFALALGAGLAAPGAAEAQMATGAARNVSIRLWFPEGVTKAKGILIFTARGIASGWANGAPMRELATRIGAAMAIVSGGDDLNDNSYPNRCASGEFNGIGEALEKIAMTSNHPEIKHAPLVGIGHSHGGDYWNWYNACHPERMAAVFVHASGGVNYSKASLKVPVIYELGTGDLIENGSKKPRAGMFVNRIAKGAPMSLVIGPGEGHNNVAPASLAMVIDLIEATFKLRVPADADPAAGPVLLNDIDEKSGSYWLGDLYAKEIAPYNDYKGNKATTVFLPNETVAKKWKETGVPMPMNIMLPTDTCNWCGTPKDEPVAKPGGMAPVGQPPTASPADAGASTPEVGTPDPDNKPPTTPPSAMDAAAPPQMTPPPSKPPETMPTTPPPAAPKPSEPSSTDSRAEGITGGCQFAGGTPAGGFALGLGLAFAALLRRRRR
jgi:hypothetical protein